MAAHYKVNETEFSLFTEAVAFAKPIRANVIQIDNGLIRWEPAPLKTGSRKVRHVIVNADGSETEFSKVRR
jgi:hypothetical protein